MSSGVCIYALLLTSLLQYSDAFSKSGGHPKFPHQICGTRAVNWNLERISKIIGGRDPPLGAVPWVVDLRYNGSHHCGGVLITTKLVLTVAHCYTDSLTIRVGATASEPSPHEQSAKVEKGIMHPEYGKYGPFSNDIAVLLLDHPIEYTSYVKPACFTNESPPPGTVCEVSGWGAYDAKKRSIISSVLKTAIIPLLSLDVCREDRLYGKKPYPILDTMVCAGSLKGGIDACRGDSGGPLTCYFEGRFVLTGLVSWGEGCARKPGVYTRVASYKEWIHEVAGELGEAV